MIPTAAELEDVPAEVWIADGRVSMSDNVETTLYIQTPEQQPEGVRDPEFTLLIKGGDLETTVSLDMEQADALRRVLEDTEDE